MSELLLDIRRSGSWPIWLIEQNSLLVIVAIIGGGIVFSILCVLLVRNYFTTEQLLGNNQVASSKLAFMTELMAGIIAFVMVGAGERYAAANGYVAAEAAAWRTMVQVVDQLAPSRADEYRDAVATYTAAVAHTEWSSMARGEKSPIAEQAFEDLLSLYFSIEPESTQAQALIRFGNLITAQAVQERTNRLTNNVSNEIATLTWYTLMAVVVISLVFNTFFGSVTLGGQLFMISMLTLGLFLNVYLAFVLGNPFAGAYAIDPAPFLEISFDARR